jgi:hypothetical protein
MNLLSGCLQAQLNALCSTMSSGVMKSFLNNSEQAKRNLCWQGSCHTIILNLDLYTMPLAQLLGQLSHGGNKTQIFQTGRMQILRHGVDISRNAFDLLLQFVQAMIRFREGITAQVLTRLLNSYR